MTKGYNSYSGRRSGGRGFLVILLLLLLIGALAFLFIQRYVVYEDGGGIRIDLPFFKAEDDPPPANDPPPAPPEELTVGTQDEAPTEPPAEEDPAPVPLVVGKMVVFDPAILHGGWEAALEAAAQGGANAFVLPLKESDGILRYPSSLTSALAAQTTSADSAAEEALAGLLDSDLYAVARINALHDNAFARANMTAAAICQLTGYVWYDHYSTHWLDPNKVAARAYIVEIAEECADMGFDEILFDEFRFPDKGRMNRIDTSAMTMTKPEALALLADELRAALDARGVKMSVVVRAEVLESGANETSGETVEMLFEKFDNVYVEGSLEAFAALQSQLGENAAKMIPMLSGESVDGQYISIS
ncbi:MAG: hypothetical protein IJF15_06295 [Oscillospiraceae bacterium]|nr:hypothetical protein [Oscillospiraceae bacterium]